MGRVVFRAAQPAFLRGPKSEQRRPARLVRQCSPGAGHFQHNTKPVRVVDGAVIDAVAVHRQRDTQMIPMGAEHHDFILQLRVATRESSEDVAADDLADLRVQFPVESNAQRNRTEIARIGRLQQFVDGLARQAQAVSRPPPASPSPQTRASAGPASQLHLRIFFAPGIAHHLPAITRRRSRVDNQAPSAPCRAASSNLYVQRPA